MQGVDKQPWVWVMGEAAGDLPYEELVKKREQEQLEKQEMEDRRKAEELAMIESQGVSIHIVLISKPFTYGLGTLPVQYSVSYNTNGFVYQILILMILSCIKYKSLSCM